MSELGDKLREFLVVFGDARFVNGKRQLSKELIDLIKKTFPKIDGSEVTAEFLNELVSKDS